MGAIVAGGRTDPAPPPLTSRIGSAAMDLKIQEGWRRGGGVRGGTSVRGARRLTLAPSLRRELFRPDLKADEVGDELHRSVERGRRELHDVVTAAVAMGRQPKPVHAMQSDQLGPIQSKFWSGPDDHDSEDEEEGCQEDEEERLILWIFIAHHARVHPGGQRCRFQYRSTW